MIRGFLFHSLFFFFFLVQPASPFKLSLKFAGGMGTLNPEPLNRTLKDWMEGQRLEALSKKNWTFLGGKVSDFRSAFDFDAELMIQLSRHFSAGLSTGYIFGELQEKNTEVTVDKVLGTIIYSHPTKAAALPLIFSGYYFFPLNKRLSLFIQGGTGILWAKYIDSEGNRTLPSVQYAYPQHQSASARGSILFGGLGFSFEVDPSLSFLIEGTARRAKVTNFHGENKDGVVGTLFSFEEFNPETEFWQSKYQILSERPAGENFRSVKDAVVDFSGFSAKIGFIIKF